MGLEPTTNSFGNYYSTIELLPKKNAQVHVEGIEPTTTRLTVGCSTTELYIWKINAKI